MYLKNISYAYKSKKKVAWEVDNVSLDKFNFIVGKNATGKSRFLALLNDLVGLFGKGIINVKSVDYLALDWDDGYQSYWDFTFIDINNNIYEYQIKIGYHQIIEEQLIFNKKRVLKRNKNIASLYSYRLNKFIDIAPPARKLTFEVRRDEVEFPFFEKLIQWSEKSRFVKFAYDNEERSFDNELGSWIKKLTKNDVESIISSMKYLGYDVEKISLDRRKVVYIKEKNSSQQLNDYELSQGMHRTLSLLVYIEYILKQEVSMILIDDLCEGLDYERATKLGKLLVEKLENSNIQFIATSNDSFLMDVIPIKYWNILQRDGNTVRALNYQNSKERFDKFLMTGLSNFDLFSSDYLMRPKP
jgi:AAA15 family ATPase/GTPase